MCEVMWDVLPLPLKCDIMFMITCMFITTCMFIITSCPHLNCHFLMNKLSLPMAVDSFPGRGTARRRRRVRSRRVASCGSQRCQKQRPRSGDSGFKFYRWCSLRKSKGWCFGTWFLLYDFPYIGKNHPNWRTHIFRGVEITNKKI